MSFLMNSADDLAADRMTLGVIGADPQDLATLAAGLVAIEAPRALLGGKAVLQ